MEWKTIQNPLFNFLDDDKFARFHYDFAMREPPKELFHYTPPESLMAILESQCMFASECTFLNDPKEFRWGEKRILRALDESSERYHNEFVANVKAALNKELFWRPYVLSLSAEPDLLSQWRAYAADGTGYAIGFNGKFLRERAGFGEDVLRYFSLEDMPHGFQYCYHLLPAIYDDKEQRQTIDQFLASAYKFWNELIEAVEGWEVAFRMMIWIRVKELLIAFKNRGYREEKEWRIVAFVNRQDDVHYRNTKYGITPYVKLNISPRSVLPGLRLPITSVWIGPNAAAKQNTVGLEMFLKHQQVDAQLFLSEIDYRP